MRPLFDTSTFTAYKRHFREADFAAMALSMVVWYELAANPIDKSDKQRLEAWRLAAARENRLLTPTMQDWRLSAQLVARLRFQDRLQHHGRTPPSVNPIRLQNDALIARAAFVHNCYVVTVNRKDFERLQQELAFTLLDAADYFA